MHSFSARAYQKYAPHPTTIDNGHMRTIVDSPRFFPFFFGDVGELGSLALAAASVLALAALADAAFLEPLAAFLFAPPLDPFVKS